MAAYYLMKLLFVISFNFFIHKNSLKVREGYFLCRWCSSELIPIRYMSCYHGLQFINRPGLEIYRIFVCNLLNISHRKLGKIFYMQSSSEFTDLKVLLCKKCDWPFGIIYHSNRYPNKTLIENEQNVYWKLF